MKPKDTMESGPIIKLVKGPTPTRKGTADAFTYGMSSLLSSFSKAAELAPHSKPELLRKLHFRLFTAEGARKRGRWFGGRFYNWCTGEISDYIPLSGTHLSQTLKAAGIATPEVIGSSGEYLLRTDIAAKAHAQLLKEFNDD